MKKDPEIVHRIINGMDINIIYIDSEDQDLLRKKIIKLLMDKR